MKKSSETTEDRDYDITGLGDAGALPVDASAEEAGKTTEEETPSSPANEDLNGQEAKPEDRNQEDPEEKGPEEDPEAGEEDFGGVEEKDEAEAEAEDKEADILKILRLAVGILSGEIPTEKLTALKDAAKAEEAIAEAYQRGLTEGRNMQIEERLEVPEVGAPDLCGSTGGSGGIRDSIFDLARMAR